MKKLMGRISGFHKPEIPGGIKIFGGTDDQMFRDKNGVPFKDKLVY